MLSFKQYISEEKLRKGLEHLSKLNHERVGSLLKSDSLEGTVTPKTDGAAGEVGYDEQGFYTRSARSDKIRNPGEYTAYTKAKRGETADTKTSSHYDEMHRHLKNNQKLISYLKSQHKLGKPSSIKGEFFLKGLGEKTDKGIKFVGTSYNPSSMGKSGMFIMHHKLPENSTHDPEHISSIGDHNVSFDHDKSKNSSFKIDTSQEKKSYSEINPDLLKSRKLSDKTAKEAETKKLDSIKNSLENKLKQHSNSVEPRPWEIKGESEGVVVHTHDYPVKIQSDKFKQFKAQQNKVSKNA